MLNLLLILAGVGGIGFVIFNEFKFKFYEQKELLKANISYKLSIGCVTVAMFSIFIYILLTA